MAVVIAHAVAGAPTASTLMIVARATETTTLDIRYGTSPTLVGADVVSLPLDVVESDAEAGGTRTGRVTLTGLAANTRIYYRPESGAVQGAIKSALTLPATPLNGFKVVLVGDMGEQTPGETINDYGVGAVFTAMAAKGGHFAIQVGDYNHYDPGDAS